MNEPGTKIAKVIPIAGGKGGIGKSLFTANLSRALAAKGERCVAVDLDLGGSNLHTFLGFDNINPGIGDYLGRKGSRLEEFLVPVPGSSRVPARLGLRQCAPAIWRCHREPT